MPAKTQFAAIPVRAISDSGLTSVELRVLACIAFHDRMSSTRGKGQGSWASNLTLAARVGCHHTNVSSALSTLAKRGYITREQHHFDKRKFVFRVIYDDPDSLPDDKPNPEVVCRSTNETPKVVCPVLENAEQSQLDAEGKYIPLSGEIYSSEEDKRYSAEAARRDASRGLAVVHDVSRFGATLAQTERGIREGEYNANLSQIADYLLQINSHATELGDNASANWAMRLIAACDRQQELVDWEGTPNSQSVAAH